MSTPSHVARPTRRVPWTRVVVGVVAAAVVVLPVAGLSLLDDGPGAVQPTGPVTLTAGHRLLFLTGQHVASAPFDGSAPATIADLECARFSVAGDTGLCLRKASAVAWSATLLDRRLMPDGAYPIQGTPSLARLSPGGRVAAWTSFLSGTSYVAGFRTQTTLLDTSNGTLTDPLDFAITIAGKKSKAGDHQLWGVTFADDNHFYATLATGNERYLVSGDIAARTLRSLAKGVTSPSVSPDGTRIAFLKAVDGNPRHGWRLAVMHLRSRRVLATADGRNVEDQAVWLDGRTLAYTVRSDDGTPSIWSVPANGTGRPSLLRNNAESPAPL